MASDAGLAVYVIGLNRCLVNALASPLLATRLPEAAVSRWRSENICVWTFAGVFILLEFSRVAQHYVGNSKGIRDIVLWEYACRRFAFALVPISLIEIAATITRMVGVVEQRMQQVQNALSCKAADFSEQVHHPCAKLVNDTLPQLAPLGFPLLWFTMKMIRNVVDMYRFVKMSQHSLTNLFDPRNQDFLLVVNVLADSVLVAFVAAVGPLRLSQALDELFKRLNDVRCNDDEMHVQVQAVEAMFQRANNGHGWGIRPCPGLVLNKYFFQTVCVRMALLATAVVAFLDSKMGFDKAEAGEQLKLSQIQRMLANASGPRSTGLL
jgi:hypothetical protein